MEDAYIALGSNLGERLSHLQDAIDRLAKHDEIHVLQSSPVYESDAHTVEGAEPQPEFLNAVVHVRTSLPPRDLLAVCMTIERLAGRVRAARWEPRIIDLDVLAYGHTVLDEPDLQIPHPRIALRRFVLKPLADLDADLWLPAPHEAYVYSLLERTPDRHQVRRYPARLHVEG